MVSELKKYNSITNSMRHVCLINKKILWNKNALNALLIYNLSKAGRNHTGKVTMHSKGKMFHRSKYRLITNKRFNCTVPGNIYRLEYDPNRSSFISLVLYKNNLFCYVLGVKHLKLGDTICSYNADVKSLNDYKHRSMYHLYNRGDSNQLNYFMIGTILHNIERFPNSGGVYIRSAGTYGKLLKKHLEVNKALIQLPSNKFIYLSLSSYATFGVVSNEWHEDRVLGKAGRSRWLGFKSTVRGVAMNPVDHPHGGGEGKKWVSLRKTPWGRIKKWKNKRILRGKYLRKK